MDKDKTHNSLKESKINRKLEDKYQILKEKFVILTEHFRAFGKM